MRVPFRSVSSTPRLVFAFQEGMRTYQRLRLISLTLAAFVALTGFSGPEKYIELGAALYGRSSAEFFYESRDNIEMTLPEGTRAEIVERTKLESGNYGYQIKVMNGENAGKTVWVFYNLENPDMTLFSRTPKRWSEPEAPAAAPAITTAPEKAVAMQTVRDTPGIKPPPEKPADAPKAETAQRSGPQLTATDIQIRESFRRLQEVNDEVKKTTAPCTTCSLQTPSAQPVQISRARTKGMDAACSAIMSQSGQTGSTGRALMSIMSQPEYKSYFMRNDSMGRFCPKFRYLTPSQKLQAWTWFWTSLAQEESSCNPQLRHPTHIRDRSGRWTVLNPREGYGLWAMEKDANVRRGRGAPCSNISTAEGQARCSVEIMVNTQLAKGRSVDVRSGSYWGPVMRGDAQILPHMRRLSSCF